MSNENESGIKRLRDGDFSPGNVVEIVESSSSKRARVEGGSIEVSRSDSGSSTAVVSLVSSAMQSFETSFVSQVTSLLAPILSKLQSISEEMGAQKQQIQTLSATVSSLGTLSATVSSMGTTVSSLGTTVSSLGSNLSSNIMQVQNQVSYMNNDVNFIVKNMFPLCLVGGSRTYNVLSVLYGAHGIGQGIFGFLDCRDANSLRLVCKEMKEAVTAFPWKDKVTQILGNLESWSAAFPKARAANLIGRGVVSDADFDFFRDLRYLNLSGIQASFTDLSFSKVPRLEALDVSSCLHLTDAVFPHLHGLHQLSLNGCTQDAFTAVGLRPLCDRGVDISIVECAEAFITAVHEISGRAQFQYFMEEARDLIAPAAVAVLRGGRRMTRDQLYIECIRLDPSSAEAFVGLGQTEPYGRSFQFSLHDGRIMSTVDLLVEALRLDPLRTTDAWSCLAMAVGLGGGSVTLSDGRILTARDILVEAIDARPQESLGYTFLSLVLNETETVTLRDTRVVNKARLEELVTELRGY